MLKTINGLPGNIIGIEAEGEVTGADYENVLIPAVDEKSKANKKIRLLYYLGSGFTGFSLKAMINDAGVGNKKFLRLGACCPGFRPSTDKYFCGILWLPVSGEVRVFPNAGFDEAKKWISAV